jgi:DNA-binding MarR family transcriptional regulator
MGQLRLEQKNTLMLIDHANETINLVIPAWRQQVLALFSLSPNDNVSELYEKLATTQQTLQKNLLSLK